MKRKTTTFAGVIIAAGGGGRGAVSPTIDLGLTRGGSVAATLDLSMATRFGDPMGRDFFDYGMNGLTGRAMEMAWTTAPGACQVMAGRSSIDIVYTANLAAPSAR